MNEDVFKELFETDTQASFFFSFEDYYSYIKERDKIGNSLMLDEEVLGSSTLDEYKVKVYTNKSGAFSKVYDQCAICNKKYPTYWVRCKMVGWEVVCSEACANIFTLANI